MKKNNTEKKQEGIARKTTIRQLRVLAGKQRLTVGIDLGDRKSHYCILNEHGTIVIQDAVSTTKAGLGQVFEKMPGVRIALEAGTHSPWASRYLAALGHEVIVANPRNVDWITKSRQKNDRLDAEKLARLANCDRKLLSPIQHRGEKAQQDLTVIRTRALLVEARTKLVNSARGQAKSLGYRLGACDCDQVDTNLAAELPEDDRKGLQGLLETVAFLTDQIKAADQQISEIAKRYPETQLLTQIYGVGELTALAFILTLDDSTRFGTSREVGAYLGMVPGRDQSGEQDKPQRITKQGDRLLRTLLVQCAHCILRRDARDSDLRRWALGKLEDQQKQPGKQKGKSGKGKKRVPVAVAWKLSVLMHHLWATGEVYDPLYGAKQAARTTAA